MLFHLSSLVPSKWLGYLIFVKVDVGLPDLANKNSGLLYLSWDSWEGQTFYLAVSYIYNSIVLYYIILLYSVSSIYNSLIFMHMDCGTPFTLLPWGPANLGLSPTPVLFGISGSNETQNGTM